MLKKIVFILFLIVLNACDREKYLAQYYDEDCDYSECRTIEPTKAQIIIKFSRPELCPNPLIFIMKENFEKPIVIDTLFSSSTNLDYLTYYLPVNQSYIVAAQYVLDNDTVLALDKNFLEKYSYKVCDSTCWKVKDTVFNVKLKIFQK